MSPDTPDLASVAIVGIVLLLGAAFAAKIVLGIHAAGRRTRAFIDSAFAGCDMPIGAPVALPFRPAPGMPHAVWLDLDVKARDGVSFDLWLWVRVGPSILLEATYPVRFDDEGDHHGLPDGTSLNNVYGSVLGKQTIATTLRLFCFPGPPPGVDAPAEVRARIAPHHAEVAFTRARLLVTVPDLPQAALRA